MRPELWELEQELSDAGVAPVCGVDEAGRGPLAGPVCAAAVILPRGAELPGLDDSKKLTEKKREALYTAITETAVSYGVAFASVEEIEERNILNAALLAMDRAIAKLNPQPALALIDGNQSRGIAVPCRCVVRGDSRCASIAAASVLAKVARDRYMREMAERYPQYGFERHKGYGTAAHYAALREHGPCEIHRPGFLKKLYGTKAGTETEQMKAGRFGEQAAAAYLTEKGYRVTARNFSCRFGEVDIIAETPEYLVFVEVKLRKDASFAAALSSASLLSSFSSLSSLSLLSTDEVSASMSFKFNSDSRSG